MRIEEGFNIISTLGVSAIPNQTTRLNSDSRRNHVNQRNRSGTGQVREKHLNHFRAN